MSYCAACASKKFTIEAQNFQQIVFKCMECSYLVLRDKNSIQLTQEPFKEENKKKKKLRIVKDNEN